MSLKTLKKPENPSESDWKSRFKQKILGNSYVQGALIILVITIILNLNYLVNSGAPTGIGGDLLATAPPILEYFKGPAYFFSNWQNTYSIIGSYGTFPGNQILYLQSFLLLVTKNLFVSYKFLQVIEIFAAGFFMFVSVHGVTKHKFDAVIAGVIYMLAPFNLTRLTGHTYIAWSFAFIPLAYFATYKTLTTGKWRYAVLAGLPLFYLLSLFPENVFLLAVPLLIFSLLIAFTYGKTSFRSVAKRISLICVMFVMGFWMALTSFILVIETYYQSIFSFSYPISTVSTGAYSYPDPPFSALTLFDGELLRISGTLTEANIVLIILGASLLVLSSVSIVFKRNVFNLSLFITGLICVIFSMGISAPTGLGLFNLFYRFVPDFNGIITPGRFIMTSYFAFVFLGLVGLRVIYEKTRNLHLLVKWRTRLSQRSIRAVTALLLIALIAVPAYFLSVNYGLQTMNLTSAETQIPQLLDSYNPQSTYRAIDLISHNGVLYILGQRTSVDAWDLVYRYYNSPSFAEILAKNNIKYIVASSSTDQFVMNDNFNEVLSASPNFSEVNVDGCTIYIDNLASPRMYVGSGALIIGGPNAISLLFALNGTADDVPLYAQQLLQEGMSLNQMVSTTDSIVFHDSDALDLAFMLIKQSYLLQPWEYVNGNGNWTIIQDNNGQQLPTAYLGSVDGQLNFANYTIYTDQPSQIQIPYSVSNSGSYEVWIRAKSDTSWETWNDPWEYMHYYREFGFPPTNNSVEINANGHSLGSINLAQYGGFQWIEAGTLNLTAGSNKLQITTSGNPVYIDSVAVVPTGMVENELSSVTNVLDASNESSLYLLEFSNYFQLSGSASRSDEVSDYTSDSASGYVTLGLGGKASTNVYIAQAGTYDFQLRASNGMFSLSVDNKQLTLSSSAKGNIISDWTWFNGTMYLSQGYHNITVTSHSIVDMDMLSLQSEPQSASASTELSFSQSGPSTWVGNLTLNKPAQLVLTENAVPNWPLQLEQNNKVQTIQPSPGFYTMNTYFINATGTVSFKINYELPAIDTLAQNVQYIPYTVWAVVLLLTLVPTAKIKNRLKGSPKPNK